MSVILLCLPTAMLLGATWAYNLTIFGSATRTGYHFWCPVPYDYPKLTFSALYLWGNLMTSFLAGLIPLALVVLTLWVAARNRESSDRSDAYARTNTMAVLEFFVLGTLPGVLFYLFYFFSDKRFFLPPLSLLAVLAGGGLGSWLSRFSRSILSVCAILLIAVSLCIRLSTTSAKSQRRLVADRIMTVTPPNALVISSVDPAYLEFMLCRSSNRRIVPTSRVVEYASKFVAPKRIDNPVPAPSNCRDHRCAGIKNGGAREVFNQVASESMELLASAISSGRPVYLDTSYCLEEEKSVIADLRMRFQFIERASHLQQLVPITPHSPIE